MNRKAQGMPIQMIGVIILVVLVVVGVAVFFFAGLSEQGGIISGTSKTVTEAIDISSALETLPGWGSD